MDLIIKGLILGVIFVGILIFVLHRVLVAGTEGAVKRLDEEISKANKKQEELDEKIRLADEELARRKEEAKALADRMRTEAEEKVNSEKEGIIAKAREEGEEIITKAQNSRDKIISDLEKQFDVKVVKLGIDLVNGVLSDKAKAGLDQTLVTEFLNNLQTVDMSKIAEDVDTVDVVTLTKLGAETQSEIARIVKEKLKRDIQIKPVEDPELGGGVILRFGSMTLDGSLRNLIRERALVLQEQIQKV